MQSCRAAPDVGTQRESQNMLTIDAQVHATSAITLAGCGKVLDLLGIWRGASFA